MPIRPLNIILSLLLTSGVVALNAQKGVYSGMTGTAHFKSDAPLEMIEAKSKQLSGAINPETNNVAFSVRINSFQGFNSALQREHFMENYMDETKFPIATFAGKFIEKLSFAESGQYDVRVKGVLNIHGVSAERILPGRLIISNDAVLMHATFSVLLQDHAINVPKLLSQKIAEVIYVQVDLPLQKAE